MHNKDSILFGLAYASVFRTGKIKFVSSHSCKIELGERQFIDTGLSLYVPLGNVVYIKPFTGWHRRAIDTRECTYEAMYHGPIMIDIRNNGNIAVCIREGELVAQFEFFFHQTKKLVTPNIMHQGRRQCHTTPPPTEVVGPSTTTAYGGVAIVEWRQVSPPNRRRTHIRVS